MDYIFSTGHYTKLSILLSLYTFLLYIYIGFIVNIQDVEELLIISFQFKGKQRSITHFQYLWNKETKY